jgi:hypothetical protein
MEIPPTNKKFHLLFVKVNTDLYVQEVIGLKRIRSSLIILMDIINGLTIMCPSDDFKQETIIWDVTDIMAMNIF